MQAPVQSAEALILAVCSRGMYENFPVHHARRKMILGWGKDRPNANLQLDTY